MSDGVTLEQFVRSKGPLPEGQLVRLAAQLVTRIEAEAHQATDGRPPVLASSRIRVLPDGKIRIDAPEASGLPLVAEFPGHAAPEEIRGEAADLRSALYSFGCTLFELATGALPYQGADAKATLQAHLNAATPDPLEYNATLSPGFARLVSELLSKDPDQRPRSTGELLGRIKGCAGAAAAVKPPAAAAGRPAAGRPAAGAPVTPAAGTAARGRTAAARPARGAPAAAGGRAPGAGTRPVAGGGTASRSAGTASRSAGAAPRRGAAAGARAAGPGPGRGARPGAGGGGGRAMRGRGSARAARRDPFADPFDDENLPDDEPRYARPRRNFIFTLSGAGVGVLLAALTMFSLRSKTSDVESTDTQAETDARAAKLRAIKEQWRGRYEAEKAVSDRVLAELRESLPTSDLPAREETRALSFLNSDGFHKPGAVAIAELARDAASRTEVLADLARGDSGWPEFVATYRSAMDEGRYYDAMDAMLKAERDFEIKEKHGTESDQLYRDAENALVRAWETDEGAITDFLLENAFARAQEKIDAARRYADPPLRRKLEQLERELNRRALALNAGGRDPEPDLGPDPGAGDDDDDDLASRPPEPEPEPEPEPTKDDLGGLGGDDLDDLDLDDDL